MYPALSNVTNWYNTIKRYNEISGFNDNVTESQFTHYVVMDINKCPKLQTVYVSGHKGVMQT